MQIRKLNLGLELFKKDQISQLGIDLDMEPPHQRMVIKMERTLQASLLRMGTLFIKRLILFPLDHLLLALLFIFHTERKADRFIPRMQF